MDGDGHMLSELARAYWEHFDAIAAGQRAYLSEVNAVLADVESGLKDTSDGTGGGAEALTDRVRFDPSSGVRIKWEFRLGTARPAIRLRLKWDLEHRLPRFQIDAWGAAARDYWQQLLPMELLAPELPAIDEASLQRGPRDYLTAEMRRVADLIQANLDGQPVLERFAFVRLMSHVAQEASQPLGKLAGQSHTSLHGAVKKRTFGVQDGWPAYVTWFSQGQGVKTNWNLTADPAGSADDRDQGRRPFFGLVVTGEEGKAELPSRAEPWRGRAVVLDWSDRLDAALASSGQTQELARLVVKEAVESYRTFLQAT